MTTFIEALKKRRSIYVLGKELKQEPKEITKIIQAAIKHSR